MNSEKWPSHLEIKKRLYKGDFSEVFLVYNSIDRSYLVIKMWKNIEENRRNFLEFKIMHKLKNENVTPEIIYKGKFDENLICVQKLVGPKLESLVKICGGQLSFSCTCLIAQQCIKNLAKIHNKNIIYGNIDPEKIQTDIKINSPKQYFIDYKYSTYTPISCLQSDDYIIQNNLYSKKNSTDLFATANQLMGGVQTRKDDLESLGFLLVYLMKGDIFKNKPEGLNQASRQQALLMMKLNYEVLVQCKDLPEQFVKYLNYVKYLRVESNINYNYLESIFVTAIKREKIRLGFKEDYYQYDWIGKYLQNNIYRTLKTQNSNNSEKHDLKSQTPEITKEILEINMNLIKGKTIEKDFDSQYIPEKEESLKGMTPTKSNSDKLGKIFNSFDSDESQNLKQSLGLNIKIDECEKETFCLNEPVKVTGSFQSLKSPCLLKRKGDKHGKKMSLFKDKSGKETLEQLEVVEENLNDTNSPKSTPVNKNIIIPCDEEGYSENDYEANDKINISENKIISDEADDKIKVSESEIENHDDDGFQSNFVRAGLELYESLIDPAIIEGDSIGLDKESFTRKSARSIESHKKSSVLVNSVRIKQIDDKNNESCELEMSNAENDTLFFRKQNLDNQSPKKNTFARPDANIEKSKPITEKNLSDDDSFQYQSQYSSDEESNKKNTDSKLEDTQTIKNKSLRKSVARFSSFGYSSEHDEINSKSNCEVKNVICEVKNENYYNNDVMYNKKLEKKFTVFKSITISDDEKEDLSENKNVNFKQRDSINMNILTHEKVLVSKTKNCQMYKLVKKPDVITDEIDQVNSEQFINDTAKLNIQNKEILKSIDSSNAFDEKNQDSKFSKDSIGFEKTFKRATKMSESLIDALLPNKVQSFYSNDSIDDEIFTDKNHNFGRKIRLSNQKTDKLQLESINFDIGKNDLEKSQSNVNAIDIEEFCKLNESENSAILESIKDDCINQSGVRDENFLASNLYDLQGKKSNELSIEDGLTHGHILPLSIKKTLIDSIAYSRNASSNDLSTPKNKNTVATKESGTEEHEVRRKSIDEKIPTNKSSSLIKKTNRNRNNDLFKRLSTIKSENVSITSEQLNSNSSFD